MEPGVTTALGIGTDSQKLYAIADNRNQIRLTKTAVMQIGKLHSTRVSDPDLHIYNY